MPRGRSRVSASDPADRQALRDAELMLHAIEGVPDEHLSTFMLELRKAARGDPEPMDPDLRRLVVQRLKLDMALRKYGRHLPDCSANCACWDTSGECKHDCACGWAVTRLELLERHPPTAAAVKPADAGAEEGR